MYLSRLSASNRSGFGYLCFIVVDKYTVANSVYLASEVPVPTSAHSCKDVYNDVAMVVSVILKNVLNVQEGQQYLRDTNRDE